jgi:hypothetical protein
MSGIEAILTRVLVWGGGRGAAVFRSHEKWAVCGYTKWVSILVKIGKFSMKMLL